MLSPTLMALIRNPETPSYAIRDAVMEEEFPVANVYVVTGETGEYSDYHTWGAAAFLEELQADAFCVKLNNWCQENGVLSSKGRVDYDARKRSCPLDPHFHCDYTGTSYNVVTIPLSCEES